MMRTLVLISICLALITSPVSAGAPEQRFTVIAFHDVVDDARDLDGDAVTTDSLIIFFEWLRGNGWHAISIDDIARARSGERALPEKPVLITFDDAYHSLYTRVYPLILAYRIPIVSAVEGSWVDAPMDSIVRYSDKDVPRSNFISWDEARQMQKSGLVEFASHSYDLHKGVLANPQGNLLPAAAVRIYSPERGYETADAFRGRIEADLKKSCELMQRELGRKPRVLAWPFGRFTGPGAEIAAAAGFEFAFTLDPEPASTAQPMAINRYWPSYNPGVGEFATNLRFDDPLPAAQRIVAVDPADLWSADPVEADKRLGAAVERLRTLGVTTVLIDAVARGADGRIEAAWFPTSELPLRGDIFSRLAWQMSGRASVQAVARLPHADARAVLGDDARTIKLFRDLAVSVPIDALLVEDASFDGQSGASSAPWISRAARAGIDPSSFTPNDGLAFRAFSAAQYERPSLRFLWLSPSCGSDIEPMRLADLSLSRHMPAGEVKPAVSRLVGLWLECSHPPSTYLLSTTTRFFQSKGGTAIGWSPDDPVKDKPNARRVEPSVSAATFPEKF
jgi:biofilm PGA synthesis lipoprotein PgaB